MFTSRILSITIVLVTFACTKAQSVYVCNTDEQCERHGEGGVCEENNFCSFPDESCATGRRWHERAGEMPGDCIASDAPGTGTGEATESGEPPGDDGEDTGVGDSMPATSAESTGAPGPVTTDPGGDGTTSGAEPATCDRTYSAVADYMLCEQTDVSCMFNATMNMVESCNDVCAAFGGSCLAGHLNDADLCVPTGDMACDDMTSNDAICVCSRP